jgi:hypothetical protein
MQLDGPIRSGLALMASLGSIFLGYLLAGHFVMATLTWTGSLGPEGAGNWYSDVYFTTHSWLTLVLVGWAMLALAFGWLGFALAKRDREPSGSTVLSGMAARFAIGGLVGGLLDVVLVAILLFVGRLWIFW